MLIIALVLAVVGLTALVTAVVTGNAVIAWLCIAASVVGVVLLIVDAVRERSRKPAAAATGAADSGTAEEFDADYPDEPEAYEADDADDAHADAGRFADLDADADLDAHADTRAIPFDQRHPDQVGAEHPEEPTTR